MPETARTGGASTNTDTPTTRRGTVVVTGRRAALTGARAVLALYRAVLTAFAAVYAVAGVALVPSLFLPALGISPSAAFATQAFWLAFLGTGLGRRLTRAALAAV